jgi:Zn-dependent protease with chaperone function
LKGLKWQFLVVDSPEVNAFAMPHGLIVCFTGLLRLLPDDNELSVVLGHELAHVVARHSGEAVSNGLFGLVTKLLVSIGLGTTSTLTSVAVDAAVSLPFSRRAEVEADALGLSLSTAACYDPTFAPRVFEKLRKAQGPQGLPAFLSTHPSSAERVKAMNQQLPGAQRLYENAGCASEADWHRSSSVGPPRHWH